jgi:hypothetical protein
MKNNDVIELELTDDEIQQWRDAAQEMQSKLDRVHRNPAPTGDDWPMRDDMPRGFFLGLRNVLAVWIATIAALAMIYTLIKLPGLP